MAADRLVLFLAEDGVDGAGRRFDDVLAFDDAALERHHDFIQWLFPLPEPSAFNPGAPVLSAGDIAAFRDDPELRGRLLAAFRRMLGSYGFTLDGDEAAPSVAPANDFATRARGWLTPGNHNMLRITRVLRCLTLLGLPAHARAFLAALEGLYDGGRASAIGPVTLRYWREAAA